MGGGGQGEKILLEEEFIHSFIHSFKCFHTFDPKSQVLLQFLGVS
jgi:hypothetical protein